MSPPERKGRPYDVVVFGATGFTGALVAEYLLERYGTGNGIVWAVAGRDPEKLAGLKGRLGAGDALPSIVADSFDEASLEALAQSARVVVSTVGPYARYGGALVEACVRCGTDYCDLAGEVQWIRRMIDLHHAAAASSGARIVHCCGFDSIPMDLGVWYLQQQALDRFGATCRDVLLLVRAMRGSASGGTAASILNVLKEAREDRQVRRILTDPYALNPAGERSGPDRHDQRGARYEPGLGTWTAPFIMAAVNTRVVRRTNALLGYAYGREFRYREAVATGSGVRGRLKALGLSAGLGAMLTAGVFTPTRRALGRFVLPSPGEGPGRDARERGYFRLRLYGSLPDARRLEADVAGERDPGYGATSRMLAESAVCLALDAPDGDGGVLTPAAAMARPLLRRLRDRAGLTFSVSHASE